jgi:hypothetical protein
VIYTGCKCFTTDIDGMVIQWNTFGGQ